jgi:hypothetical protein
MWMLKFRVLRAAAVVLGVALLAPSVASAAPIAPNQCAVAMLGVKSTRAPNGASPYSGYSSFNFSGSQTTDLDDVAFVITQRFPVAGYGAWQLYPQLYQLPTAVINNTAIEPNAGSVNPYDDGTPIFAPNRSYRLLITSDGVDVDSLPARFQNIENQITWPAGSAKFNLLGRSYGGKTGYDTGGYHGRLNIDWPDVRTFDVHTGLPMLCGNVQPARDVVQSVTPYNTSPFEGLLDGANPSFRDLLPGFRAGRSSWPPKPNNQLLEFFRMPSFGTGLPGGASGPPDNCSNYLEARLNQNQFALFRVPKVPTFQPTNPSAGAVYHTTDAGFYTIQVNGFLRADFQPGDPNNFALGAEAILQDASGGATFMVWPRSLAPAQRPAVFAYAQQRGWNLLEGNQNTLVYPDMVFMRINGPSESYTGGAYPTEDRSGAPCMNGPQDVLDQYPAFAGLTAFPYVDPQDGGQPFNTIGEGWAVTPPMLGSAAPQGVQCSRRGVLTGNCLARLRQHIRSTGGRYIATG